MALASVRVKRLAQAQATQANTGVVSEGLEILQLGTHNTHRMLAPDWVRCDALWQAGEPTPRSNHRSAEDRGPSAGGLRPVCWWRS